MGIAPTGTSVAFARWTVADSMGLLGQLRQVN